MIDRTKLEQELAQFPLFQYEFIKTEELMFSDRVRYICETECPMYEKTWACPPAVGSVEECKARCLQFEDALLLSTVTEVSDIANLQETLDTRGDHEAIVREIRDLMQNECTELFVLSTEACAHCEQCCYPALPCCQPDNMFPCIESHGIVLTDLAEKRDIPFFNGNIVTWFSLIFYK